MFPRRNPVCMLSSSAHHRTTRAHPGVNLDHDGEEDQCDRNPLTEEDFFLFKVTSAQIWEALVRRLPSDCHSL
ncbi:hypothetical protein AMECASPLE_032140 [Ameca splendens]|uniref:Uncharacterized protein n=1 Tax=Ameca splendens TaxID=208324 RepID=A0ABV0Z4P5_9TELE